MKSQTPEHYYSLISCIHLHDESKSQTQTPPIFLKSKPPLPNIIRDELRMTIALQGQSHFIQGKGRTMKSQCDQMIMFYHGQKPNRPNQIKLLRDGTASYRCVCDST